MYCCVALPRKAKIEYLLSMSALAGMLEEVGFEDVKTYIQSGNIALTSEWSDEEIRTKVYDCIYNNIGADLSVIVKDIKQLTTAIAENPFDKGYDASMCHLVFTNDLISDERLQKMLTTDFGDELFAAGNECLYLYLPEAAVKKRLYTNFIERQLGIRVTIRKLHTVLHLISL